MKDIVIIGCGDFGREVNWIINRINNVAQEWNIIGFVDDNEEYVGKTIDGVKVIGKVEKLSEIGKVYTICAICDAKVRKNIIKKVSGYKNVSFAILTDPTCICHKTAKIGEGTIICCNTMVNINTTIGKHVAMVDRSAVGHDSVIGDYSVLLVGAVVAGNSQTGECCELGMGANMIQNKKIGDNVIVGAGACVVKNLPDNCTAVGVPAKVIKHN